MTNRKSLFKILSKCYKPNSIVDIKHKELDITFKTDHIGNPVVMFIGKRLENGNISGEHFVRTLIRNDDGEIIKDHWVLKGRAT
jgi:hypothetical protein